MFALQQLRRGLRLVFSSLTVRPTAETSTVETLNDIPVNFPFKAGSTLPAALAAPTLLGMMLNEVSA